MATLYAIFWTAIPSDRRTLAFSPNEAYRQKNLLCRFYIGARRVAPFFVWGMQMQFLLRTG